MKEYVYTLTRKDCMVLEGDRLYKFFDVGHEGEAKVLKKGELIDAKTSVSTAAVSLAELKRSVSQMMNRIRLAFEAKSGDSHELHHLLLYGESGVVTHYGAIAFKTPAVDASVDTDAEQSSQENF